MPRDLPTGITEPDLSWLESHDIAKITLSDGVTILRLGTAEVTTDDGAYDAAIVRTGEVKQSITRSADNVTFEAQNVDRQLGLTLNDTADTLVGATVVYSRVFRVLGGVGLFVADPMITGEISDVDVNQETVTIKVVGDLAAGAAYIANRPVQIHCPLVFKGEACGYSGPLETCNKVYQDAGGCSGRDNQHRFGGVIVKGEIAQPIFAGNFDEHIQDWRRRRFGDYIPDLDIGRNREVDLMM
jgi:hypothetical protein